MPVLPFQGKAPEIADDVFIAPTAYVIGDVKIGAGSSVFFGAVLRGDIQPIVVGARSNIQDQVTIHTSRGIGPCTVEDNATIGHGAVLHGCTIQEWATVGMQATVLDRAVLASGSMAAAQALIRVGQEIPAGMVAGGVPAKVIRALTEDEKHFNTTAVEHYVRSAEEYRRVCAEA
ncbi:gamma carbonic anhydrase family protein [bacterium]|nr:gamma carbonic anhydrase family protein [bacterium]